MQLALPFVPLGRVVIVTAYIFDHGYRFIRLASVFPLLGLAAGLFVDLIVR